MEDYLKLFKTEADYEAASEKPTVSHIIETVDVKIKAPEIDTCEQYGYIDLGLPSGTLWGCKNVGAATETEYGNYYNYGKGSKTYQETKSQSKYSGTENPLALSADTAHLVLGGDWHTPTESQYSELYLNTNLTWEENFNNTGVNGAKLTSKTDPRKYVFFPACGWYYKGNGPFNTELKGYYMTSTTPIGSNQFKCASFEASLTSHFALYYNERAYYGVTVRGVIG